MSHTVAIHRWCQSAWNSATTEYAGRSQSKNTDDSANEVERLVSDAAFLKFLETRGIDTAQIDSSSCDLCLDQNGAAQSLALSCAINPTSPPELLGAIHEKLVMLRKASAANGTQRRLSPRKQSGIFYTPAPIIEDMLRQTLGRRLESATPEDIACTSILDPAAGCGAFLVAAFRYLIDWYRDWYVENQPEKYPDSVQQSKDGWRITWQACQLILKRHIFGVDLDESAIRVARRILYLVMIDATGVPPTNAMDAETIAILHKNLKCGNSLLGAEFSCDDPTAYREIQGDFDWNAQFPQIASRGGFDLILGNPPYRRERDFKQEMDQLAMGSLAQYRAPRMDLWYYFAHRGIQLLRETGSLSFITNSYWTKGTGAERLIASLRDVVHLDELVLLGDLPVFPGVTGQHLIFRLTKCKNDGPTTIRAIKQKSDSTLEGVFRDPAAVQTYSKSKSQLFRANGLNLRPSGLSCLDRLASFATLGELGVVRQGIAENPAVINRRTIERFPDAAARENWELGEGVFSLSTAEVIQFQLNDCYANLLRPYHTLSDLNRYWLARTPSRKLIYSTRQTIPSIADYPELSRHLGRFRAILESRRETTKGINQWWHLHWPRDQRIWRAPKIVALQMAKRPSFVSAAAPVYVSFSANVFLPSTETAEDLRYLTGLLNSTVVWAWLSEHAKRRGIGLELNGHVLEQIPIRRINFQNPNDVQRHDELVELVKLRMELEQRKVESAGASITEIENDVTSTESQLDAHVAELYGIEASELESIQDILMSDRTVSKTRPNILPYQP